MKNLDLYIKKYEIDEDKKGGYVLICDKNTKRCCWYDIWDIDNEQGYNFDFNQYIFFTDNSIDIEAQDFQKELSDYSIEVDMLISELLYDLELLK